MPTTLLYVPFIGADCDSQGGPMRLVRDRPRDEGGGLLPMSELRPGDDRAVPPMSGSRGPVHVPRVRIPGALRMGRVAVTFRVMPADSGVDVESLATSVRATVGPGLRDVAVKPIAFGLRAV